MDAEKNRQNLRRVRGIVKYGAALMTLMGAIHFALIFFGFEHIYFHLLWCVCAATLGVYLNKLFQLCVLHLACVWYIVLILVLMSLEGRVAWIEDDVFTAGVAFVGLILFLLLLWRAKRNC